MLDLFYNSLKSLYSILFEDIAVPTLLRYYIRRQIRVRGDTMGSQPPIARLAVEAELGPHRADSVESRGGGNLCGPRQSAPQPGAMQ